MMFDVPEAECRLMLARVAGEVYGFDLEKLTPVGARVGPRVVTGEPFRPAQPLEATIAR